MGANNRAVSSSDVIVGLFFFFSWLLGYCSSSSSSASGGVPAYNSMTMSSFRYSDYKLNPFDWRYIRVDLPPWFSSLSLNLQSDVDIDERRVKRISKSKLPLICLRNGSPPLPDASDASVIKGLVIDPIINGTVGDIQDLQHQGLCCPLQKNIMLRLTNEQISAGIWYIGLFNGIGTSRTQSKMINRGSPFTLSANISVEGCTISGMWGHYCNYAIVPLSCEQNISDAGALNQTADIGFTCRNSFGAICSMSDDLKIYSLDITGTVQLLKILATSFANSTVNASGTLYARHGAIPSRAFHDYSADIGKSPLVIESPMIGRWFIGILPGNQTKLLGSLRSNFCYSLDWQVLECPLGKAGPNCSSESYMLQSVLRKSQLGAFESHFLPVDGKMSPEAANFPLEPLLSNSSNGNKSDMGWTYFGLDIPHGAGGANIHVHLESDKNLNYEIYSRFGGLPSLDTWDYYYVNSSSNSNGSAFFKVYDSSDDRASFYMLNAREGHWTFGLRHPVPSASAPKHQTTMSLSIERCPNRCSDHGQCRTATDDTGLSFYSYCSCDRNHGGFDCGITIVTHSAHMWQSVALIASNAAALLPAFWALRKKALAEWVVFTASGVSSALYHACDVGVWCILNFHVLQFMDFWLSFMAVVSTFVYLTTIGEVTKRAIHTAAAILTALMAITGATRSSNISLVIAIGVSGLVLGLVLEFSSSLRSIFCSGRMNLNIIERWLSIKAWLYNLLKTIRNRFRWGFVFVGFIFVFLAGLSWKLETTSSYWIWHSLWHVSIYTSSFFFLCSKLTSVNGDAQVNQDTPYELTRQNSFPSY